MKSERRDLIETAREATRLLRLMQQQMSPARFTLSKVEDIALWDQINKVCADLGQFDPEMVKLKEKK